jgi:hypothetical protein
MYTLRKFWKNPSTAISKRCREFSAYRCAWMPVSSTRSSPNTRADRSPSRLSWLSALLLLLLLLLRRPRTTLPTMETIQASWPSSTASCCFSAALRTAIKAAFVLAGQQQIAVAGFRGCHGCTRRVRKDVPCQQCVTKTLRYTS